MADEKRYIEVPAAEVNKAPGRYFDRVFRGESLLLTRYGRPYVLLCPPPETNEEPQRQAG